MNFGLLCDLRDTNSYSTMYHLARYVLAAGARGGDRRYIEEMASIKACSLWGRSRKCMSRRKGKIRRLPACLADGPAQLHCGSQALAVDRRCWSGYGLLDKCPAEGGCVQCWRFGVCVCVYVYVYGVHIHARINMTDGVDGCIRTAILNRVGDLMRCTLFTLNIINYNNTVQGLFALILSVVSDVKLKRISNSFVPV